MDKIKQYIEENKQRFLDELFDLIRIPSISAEEKHKQDMYRVQEYWRDMLLKMGVDKAEIYETTGHPLTYAEKIIDPDLPTVLVYGHADVMPVDPLDEWETDPFEPVIKDGKIYARGADDDKGQSMIQAKAFETVLKTGQLGVNVKFVIEGEEEIGSAALAKWMEEHKDMLKADIILVSDTGMIAKDIPSITVGLRGLSYVEVTVKGPNRDLHSGLFGGAVANPANVLAKMIGSLHDDDGRITIPGFYDDVLEYPEEIRKKINQAPFDEEEYKKALGVDELWGEKGYTTIERTGIRPTLDVNGMWSGYTGEGAKTIIPSTAHAKISMRLVPNQSSEKITELFTKHFKAIAPKSVKVDIKALHGGEPYVCPVDLPAYKAAEKAYAEVFGREPIPQYSGGSIPIISTFEKILGTKTILMGFGLEEDRIHAPNENFPLDLFYKGIETVARFYIHYAQIAKQA